MSARSARSKTNTPRKSIRNETNETASIKSHINQPITRSTLLSNPVKVEPSKEQKQELDKKLARMKAKCKEDVNRKPATRSTKSRIANTIHRTVKAQHEPFRAPPRPIDPSPSKRKLSQPRKLIVAQQQNIGRAAIFTEPKAITKPTNKKAVKIETTRNRNVNGPCAESLASVAITTIDAPFTTTVPTSSAAAHRIHIEKGANKKEKIEESVDAIRKHLAETACTTDSSTAKIEIPLSTSDNKILIQVLEATETELSASPAKLPPKKAHKSLALLPLLSQETSQSTAANAKLLAVNTKSEQTTAQTAKVEKLHEGATKTIQAPSRDDVSSPNTVIRLEDKENPMPSLPKLDVSIHPIPSEPSTATPSTPATNLVTPYKNPLSAQMRELFGDFVDTPDKCTPMKQPKEPLRALAPSKIETPPIPEATDKEKPSDQSAIDCSAASNEGDNDSDASSEYDDDYYYTFQTQNFYEDEEPHFLALVSTNTKKPNVLPECRSFPPTIVNLSTNCRFQMTVTDEMVLFQKDAVDLRARVDGGRGPKLATKPKEKSPATDKVTGDFGKPLKTSTPTGTKMSPNSSVKAKFKVKPKESQPKSG